MEIFEGRMRDLGEELICYSELNEIETGKAIIEIFSLKNLSKVNYYVFGYLKLLTMVVSFSLLLCFILISSLCIIVEHCYCSFKEDLQEGYFVLLSKSEWKKFKNDGT